MVKEEVIDGGWFAPETSKLSKEVLDVLKKASANVAGAVYTPVVLLGTQVVAGFNYSMLCEITPVTENPESHYAIVVVNQSADGTTSILETYDFVAEDAK